MRIIKRLDTFTTKAFLQLMAATFFVCLFVYMMQYTWRYLEELIGKGLSMEVMAKFFWYMGLTFVPLAIPPAVLLASLITFGNMGEKLELLSMKAAGIPLMRVFMPLAFIVLMLSGCSFYFQNNVGPEASKQLAALLWSMKQKSPELEIPEGEFYGEIPGYNIYVEHKDKQTGMLYGVMIYTNVNSQEETQIVLADSARLQSTEDKMHLMLTLYNGERFRNMDARSANMMKAEVPYMRETFTHEVDLIAFNGNFNAMDASLFSGNAQTKGLRSIRHGIDSLENRIDSTGRALYAMERRSAMERDLYARQGKDSADVVAQVPGVEPFDTLYAHLTRDALQSTVRTATAKVRQLRSEYEFRSLISNEENRQLRIHKVEQHRKFTYSLACLIFFFIGAPLGAIIRKGGLGMPVIIGVSIFIFYYIINANGEKLAKSGTLDIAFGVWMSTLVLAPIGMFLTYKSNQDSAIFNVDGYRMFLMRLLGLRESRKLNRKEVVINDPDYPALAVTLGRLQADCRQYTEEHRLMRMPNYRRMYFEYEPDTMVRDIDQRLEALVSELHNSQDRVVLDALNDLPILVPDAHTRPFGNARRNMVAGIVLPVGLFFYLRIWRYRLRLLRDMNVIEDKAKVLIDRIEKIEGVA